MTLDEIRHLQPEDLLGMSIKAKIVFFGIVSSIIVAVTWFYFISPKISQYEDLQQRISSEKTEIRNKQYFAVNLPAYQKQIKEMDHRFQLFLEQLPNRKQIPSLLDSITTAGRENGLQFSLFQPTDPNRKDFYEEIPVKIEATGTYNQIGRFLGAVAAMPRIVTIKNVEITPRSTNQKSIMESGSPILVFKGIAITYRYRKNYHEKFEKGKKS